MEHQQSIYWEQQLYALCGVHCVNALLQGPFYDEVQLAIIALQLDQKERQLMEAEGDSTKEFLQYMAEDSHNVAQDGNYSIQVLEEALKRIGQGIKIVSIETLDQVDPSKQTAFICNTGGTHWLTLRKVRDCWYNLNSLLSMPERIVNGDIGTLIDTYKDNGSHIWIVRGLLPLQNPELFKDLNDNQMLVLQSIIPQQVIKAPTVHSSHPGKVAGVDGIVDGIIIGHLGHKQSNKSSTVGFAGPTVNYQNINNGASHGSDVKNGKNGASPSKPPSLNTPIPKCGYGKFDIADPSGDIQLFMAIRNQIAESIPYQPQGGLLITFVVDDARQLTRRFNPSHLIEQLYDFMFVTLTAKTPKKKVGFVLEHQLTKQPLMDTSLPICLLGEDHVRLIVRQV